MSGKPTSKAKEEAIAYRAKQMRALEALDPGDKGALLAEMINEQIELDAVRISESEFKLRFLPWLLSEDKDESEYYHKKLVEWAGHSQQGIAICKDNDPDDVLFHIPSLLPTFHTQFLTDDERVLEEGFTFKMNSFYRSQFAMVPSHKKHFIEGMARAAEHILSLDESKLIWYLGWYEVMDYYGKLPDEDEKVYAPFRYMNDTQKHWLYWRKDVSIREYLGRSEDFYVERYNEIHGIENKKPDTPVTQTSQDELDTDDWE